MTDVQRGTPATSDPVRAAAFEAAKACARPEDIYRQLDTIIAAVRPLIEAEARADERRKVADEILAEMADCDHCPSHHVATFKFCADHQARREDHSVTELARSATGEPPDGAACRGNGQDRWVRRDVPEDPGSTWWLYGDAYSYQRAVAAGLDAARRLVEVPDPRDGEAMAVLARRSGVIAARCIDVVRALTEQGDQQ